jgi:hypothetical protein
MANELNKNLENEKWKPVYKLGGIACWVMLAIMIIQIVIFVIWPPTENVVDFFALFSENWLLGLLSLDFLYLVNNTILILIYLALYFSLRKINESAMLIAMIVGIVGITLYYASNVSFEMLRLSNEFMNATSEVQKNYLIGAGSGLMAIYRGTAFNVYYVLNAITLLVLAIVMLKSNFYSKTTAIIGISSGILMAIPSSAGTIGVIFSLASLIPWAIFIILISKKFFQLAGQNQS